MPRRSHLFGPAALLLLAWGVFAFGSEFTWAYAPLLTMSLAVSGLALLASRGLPDGVFRTFRPLILALALTLGASATQIVRLPASAVAAISPSRNAADYSKLYAQSSLGDYEPSAPQVPARTISVEPSRTMLGMTFLVILSLLLVSSAAGFGAVRPTFFARGVVVIGALAAFAELVARSHTENLVYGFFVPRQPLGTRSAPFINRDHTAGFLTMAVALTMGHFASCVSIGWRNIKPDWRSRLHWLSSADAAESLFTAMALVFMMSALIATQSRSGLLCLALVAGLFAGVVLRQGLSRRRKLIALAGIVAVIIAATAFGDVGKVLERFASSPLDARDRRGRPAIWRMTIDIARNFPLTGTGLNTYGIAALPYQPNTQLIFIEAHNDYLQLASEGGVLVGLPIVASVVGLIVLIRRRFRSRTDDRRTYWLRVGATLGLSAMAVQSLFDFTLQMPGAAVMFVMLAAIAIHRPWLKSQDA
jgi:O-antigen ligase